MSLSRFIISILLLLSLFEATNALAESDYVFPPPDDSLLRLLVHDDIGYPDSFFLQFGVGGSAFDVRTQNWTPRWSPGIEVGERFGRFGAFLNLALDETFDLTEDIEILNIIHLGIGVEHLALLGRLRSSWSIGAAILETDTSIDHRGTTGWYTELRPVSLRFGPSLGGVFELSPLGLNISIPVTKGIPLVLFSYFTTLSFEWDTGPWHFKK